MRYLRRASSSTKTSETSLVDIGAGLMTVKKCIDQGGGEKCCKEAEHDSRVDESSLNNCKLCHHPDCSNFVASRPDPGISFPGQIGRIGLENPNK